MKRITALLVLAVMLFSMISPAGFADTGQPFLDVPADSWYAEDVAYAVERGIVKGTSRTTFSPDAHASRGQFVTILYRLEGCPEPNDPEDEPAFDDVDPDAYYAIPIAWATQNQITKGVSSRRFLPDEDISRAAVATILYRTYGQSRASDLNLLSAFKDEDEIPDWAREAVAWAVQTGIMKGKSKTRFDPNAPVKRSELAAIIHRFCEWRETPSSEVGVILDGKLLTLEESTAQLIEDFGEPDQKIESAYPFTWWAYDCQSYQKFFLVGVDEDRIVALWIENRNWRSVSGYRAGCAYDQVADRHVFTQPNGKKETPYGYYACLHTPYDDYRMVRRTDQTHLDNEAIVDTHLISAFRVFNGLQPLTFNAAAAQAAQRHSDDMKEKGFASHIGSDGSTPKERLRDVGLGNRYLGETIGAGIVGIILVHTNLISSTPHRAILLLATATGVGIGVAYGRVNNATGLIVTEDFIR